MKGYAVYFTEKNDPQRWYLSIDGVDSSYLAKAQSFTLKEDAEAAIAKDAAETKRDIDTYHIQDVCIINNGPTTRVMPYWYENEVVKEVNTTLGARIITFLKRYIRDLEDL